MSNPFFVSRDLMWFRWGEIALVLTRQRLLFSERMGYTKYRKLLFGWRLVIERGA
jgi:hypothetical protein